MSSFKCAALICLFLLSFQFRGFGQTSDSAEPTDTTVSSKEKKKNPQNIAASKAARLSAIVPGLGQVYNKKYWKLPILYVGAATITYFIITNNQDYNTFKGAYIDRTSGKADAYLGIYSTDQLRLIRDDARRYRDMSILFGLGLYALNIIDAYVDRHLMEFDVGDELSMKVRPFLYTANYRQFTPGLTLNFALKK